MSERENGCWNCERGCVPNYYDYGRCPWKHSPEKEKKHLEMLETLSIYKHTKRKQI